MEYEFQQGSTPVSQLDLCVVTIEVLSIPEGTPPGEPLYVAGNFNNWNARDENARLAPDGARSRALRIAAPVGAVLEYKITRGSWDSVETESGLEPMKDRRTLVEGDGQEIAVTVEAWEDRTVDLTGREGIAGTVKVIRAFSMPQLSTSRRIWIYLPPDYASSNKRYPVIYMQDGQNLFDERSSFAGTWRIDETMEQLHATSAARGAIVVAPDNGADNRINEYAPWRDEDVGAGGDGDKYVDFLVHTLKPFIDAQFRTLRDRRSTGILGSSMGGLVSLYAALKYPDVFSRVGALSSSFWFARRSMAQTVREWARAGRLRAAHPMRIYLYVGGMEGGGTESDTVQVQDTVEMFHALRDSGFSTDDVKLDIDDRGRHAETVWADGFARAYRWLYGDT